MTPASFYHILNQYSKSFDKEGKLYHKKELAHRRELFDKSWSLGEW
jgi:hypothetical protein